MAGGWSTAVRPSAAAGALGCDGVGHGRARRHDDDSTGSPEVTASGSAGVGDSWPVGVGPGRRPSPARRPHPSRRRARSPSRARRPSTGPKPSASSGPGLDSRRRRSRRPSRTRSPSRPPPRRASRSRPRPSRPRRASHPSRRPSRARRAARAAEPMSTVVTPLSRAGSEHVTEWSVWSTTARVVVRDPHLARRGAARRRVRARRHGPRGQPVPTGQRGLPAGRGRRASDPRVPAPRRHDPGRPARGRGHRGCRRPDARARPRRRGLRRRLPCGRGP